jgi:outer membrane murein-binding lipoprotein Lpp
LHFWRVACQKIVPIITAQMEQAEFQSRVIRVLLALTERQAVMSAELDALRTEVLNLAAKFDALASDRATKAADLAAVTVANLEIVAGVVALTGTIQTLSARVDEVLALPV